MARSVTIILGGLLLSVVAYRMSLAQNETIRRSITEFGAVTDSETVNTEAIQRGIDAISDSGGGTLVVPSGTYLSGAIFLKPKVNLHIESDGVLKGTTSLADYPLVQSRWEGEERIWVSALINAFYLSDLEITGSGTIDGSGDVWHVGRRPMEDRNLSASLPNRIGPERSGPPPLGPPGGLKAAPDSPAYQLREIVLPDYARPRLIAVQNCERVLIDGLNILNQASWGVFALYSKQVEMSNLKIRAEHYIPSSDGIDIDSCDGVHIHHIDIDVNDDCISIKSGKDEDGRRVARPAENILIEKCKFRYGHGGVAVGSEMSGGIRNMLVRNCVFDADNWAPIRFKSQPSRGGLVQNITYRDLKLEGTRKAFEFNMAWRMVNAKPAADPLPVVRNVRIINVTGTVAEVGDIRGLKESPVTNVVFEQCHITATKGLLLENIKDLNLDGLQLTVSEGEAIIRKNAE